MNVNFVLICHSNIVFSWVSTIARVTPPILCNSRWLEGTLHFHWIVTFAFQFLAFHSQQICFIVHSIWISSLPISWDRSKKWKITGSGFRWAGCTTWAQKQNSTIFTPPSLWKMRWWKRKNVRKMETHGGWIWCPGGLTYSTQPPAQCLNGTRINWYIFSLTFFLLFIALWSAREISWGMSSSIFSL